MQLQNQLKCLENNRSLLVFTLSGYLAIEYKNKFDEEIDAGTIHGSSKYPLSVDEWPKHNWNLANYDLIVLDEFSVAPTKIFKDIVTTLY